MARILSFADSEILEPVDLDAIGVEARSVDDAISEGALGWPAHQARIAVSSPAANVVRLSVGDLHAAGTIYSLSAQADVSLQSYLPLLSQDERWIALILRGQEIEEVATRAFETSEEPLEASAPANAPTPKFQTRRITIVVQQGEVAPAPAIRPTIDPTDCCVAFVKLKSTGIVEIVPNENGRVKTVYEIEGRLTALELLVDILRKDTIGLTTDIANVAASIKQMPDKRVFAQVVRDTARLRQRLNFPDEARNYFFDEGLVKDFWDLNHVQAAFRVDEGLRFPPAAMSDQQLRLLDAGQANLKVWNNLHVLPDYDDVVRVESPQGTGRQDISNTVHTVRTAHRRRVKHTRIRYGETVRVCENMAGWEKISERKAGEIFAVRGAEFVSLGAWDTPYNRDPANSGHLGYTAQRVIRDTYSKTYTTYSVEEFGLSGAIYAQTFLSSQCFVCTGVRLYFTRVDAVGNVLLGLCEALPDGSPDYDSVITYVEKAPGTITLNGYTTFAFEPALLEPGKRYAWFTVTTGNHQLMQNAGNAFAGGTKFISSDGVW